MTDTDCRCPRCGAQVTAEYQGLGWCVACPNCYDGAEDSSPEVGSGLTLSGAIESYRDSCELHGFELPGGAA